MIRIASLFPKELNLNGDQSNLLVLEKRIKAFGGNVQTISFHPGDDVKKLEDVDFLLIGHGSMAAWSFLRSELERIQPRLDQLRSTKCIFLAVASGAEKLFDDPLRWFQSNPETKNRESKFVTVEFNGFRVLGYTNSATTLPLFEKIGNVHLTSLHGPVLAKNPILSDYLLGQLGVEIKQNPAIEQLNEFVDAIWRLEEPLAD